ncbi:MAG: extracellular solute-binding protein [Caldilineaceae bacterium]
MVWHDWPEPDAALLEELMASYMKLFPGVHIVLKYVPANQILARYEEKVASGLGPDLLLGVEAYHLGRFARDGYLLDLADYSFDTQHIQPKTLDALRLDDRLYGVPLVGFTDVMYFNKARDGADWQSGTVDGCGARWSPHWHPAGPIPCLLGRGRL